MDLIDTLKNADIIYKSQEDKQDILELLCFTDSYLMDTYMIQLNVITSE